MAVTRHTLTGDFGDIVGDEFAVKSVKAYLSTNLPAGQALVNLADNEIQVGAKELTLDSSGAFSVSLIASDSADTNIDTGTLEYRVTFSYVNPATRTRDTWDSSYFALTADADLSDVAGTIDAPIAWRSAFITDMEAIQAAAEAARDAAIDISNISTPDALVEALVKNTGGAGPLTSAALTATIGSEVAAQAPAVVAARALATVAPATVLLRHDFALAADTSAGSIGSPDVGPGGAWSLTGATGANARILSGKFMTTGAGVTYAYLSLAAKPDVVVTRGIWAGTSGPTFGVMDSMNTTIFSGPHIQVSKNTMNPFIFNGGTTAGPALPPTYPPITSPTLTLSDGVEYEIRTVFDWANDAYTTMVRQMSDGTVLGVYTGVHPGLSALPGAGPFTFFIEPDANFAYTYVEAWTHGVKPIVAPPVRSPGGFTGPIGIKKPDVGAFDRIGVGTTTPTVRIHVAGSSSGTGVLVDSTHTSGGWMRIKSAAGAESTLWLQRNGEADNVTNMLNVRSSSAGLFIGFGTVAILQANRTSGRMDVTPTAGNNGRLVIQGNGAGTTAAIELQANGVATASRVYGSASASDLRFATNGSDRVIITSAGAFNILGTLDHDGANVGFYGATPVAKQTGVTVDAAGIHAALVNLGLIGA